MCDYACVLADLGKYFLGSRRNPRANLKSFKAVYAFQTFPGFFVSLFGESLTIKFTVNIIIKWNQILNESKFL